MYIQYFFFLNESASTSFAFCNGKENTVAKTGKKKTHKNKNDCELKVIAVET